MRDSRNSQFSKRLTSFALQVYSSANIGTWCFSLNNKKLFASTFPYDKEFLTLLEEENILTQAASVENSNMPVLLSDSLGFLWVSQIAAFHQDNRDAMLFLLGPISLTSIDQATFLEYYASKNLPLSLKSAFTRIINEVPILSYSMVEQYAKMFHSAILGDVITASAQAFTLAIFTPQTKFDSDSKKEYQRGYQLEQELLLAIKEGRESYFTSLKKTVDPINFDFKISDSIRQSKDAVIIFIALCSRAAIEGGLSLDISKEMEASYIRQTENAKTITEIANINMHMFEDYCKQVALLSKNSNLSAPIQNCCNYIRQNYTNPITLSEIAEYLGYTEYYLSRKFHKEMGLHVSDYINELRLNHAKQLLMTTTMNVDDISSLLQYSSRTYFSRIFKKIYGMSPAQYRSNLQSGLSKIED